MSQFKIEDQYITNPVIINIGIFKYDYHHQLSACSNDVKTMNNLWRNIYGYDHDAIFSNKKPYLTQNDFWDIIRDAKEKLNQNRGTKYNSLIISMSCHGTVDMILTSEHNPNNIENTDGTN